MGSRRVHVSVSRGAVMTLGRAALRSERCVYVLTTNKRIRYPNGRSRVVYIGTTQRGVYRVASSLAYRAGQALDRRGAQSVEAHLLTYSARTGKHNLWKHLERAALVMFQIEYGSIPILNKTGKHFWPGREFEYFSKWPLCRKLKTFG